MKVYRITLAKWSNELIASGFPARWNSKGSFVIYTAGSISLACLENVVHRSGEGLNQNFKVMTIEIPSKVKISIIEVDNLTNIDFYSQTQQLGDKWIKEQKTAVLKVKSSIISKEFNYLINPNHLDFQLIKLIGTEDFTFDPRIKE